MKTKTGEQITWAEALKRFKQGLADLTPIQKLKNEARGTLIILIGFIVSFGAVIWKRTAIGFLAYGLILIFLGSIIITGLKYISIKQQLKYFEKTEKEAVNVKELLKDLDDKCVLDRLDGNKSKQEVK